MRVSLSAEARKRYEVLYHTELNDSSAGERVTALLERRAPMLLRLALLFALCDLTTEVQLVHINAALAWVRYSVDSVKFIFSSAADEVATAETNDTAQKIVDFLKAKTTATRWELSKNCFGGHASKAVIDAALDDASDDPPPLLLPPTMPIPNSTPTTAAAATAKANTTPHTTRRQFWCLMVMAPSPFPLREPVLGPCLILSPAGPRRPG